MKDAEDEAFDDLAKRQGAWGGGFKAKRAMAADKLQEPPSEWAGIKAILDEYGVQAIDFVADFKAALAQPAQEPVTWAGVDFDISTAPPQRPWVGLTAEEIASIPLNEYTLQTAERLLKEKNK